MKNVIILANGEFPKNKNTLKLLNNNSIIISCDGATNNLIEYGLEPNFIIGDMDSISDKLKNKYKHKIINYTEQNSNDLTKAVNWCINNKITEITILGASGKREDHTLANISLLFKYANEINVKMITDYGIFTPITSNHEFSSIKGQQVSIFSSSTETKITSINLKFPLNNLQLKQLWQGTLNESLSETFKISFENGTVIIYQAFEL